MKMKRNVRSLSCNDASIHHRNPEVSYLDGPRHRGSRSNDLSHSFHAVRPPAALTWRQREPITSMEWTAHSTQAALPGLNKTFLRAIRTAAASPVAFDARGGSQVIVLPCITTGSGRRWRQRRRDAVVRALLLEMIPTRCARPAYRNLR